MSSALKTELIGQKISSLFVEKLDLTDIAGYTDAEKKRRNILSRALAAYALYYKAKIDEDIAAQSVTDGENDNGVDAIYYSARNNTLYLVQSKWIDKGSGEVDIDEIRSYIKGIKDLYDANFDRFNVKINKKKNQIRNALGKKNAHCEVIFIYTGSKPTKNSIREFEDLVKIINDDQEDNISYSILELDKIYDSITKEINEQPINLNLSVENFGVIDSPYKAYYGYIAASEIYKWWQLYEDKLFKKNIRKLLGTTNINIGIKQTIESDPTKFWYFHNGITIICNKFTKSPMFLSRVRGLISCEGVSIVNGAQTVGTIGKLDQQLLPQLRKTLVPIRIISLEGSDPNFGVYITQYTNKQNRIDNIDFVSLDPVQIMLKEQLALDNIIYNIARSEDSGSDVSSFNVTDSTTALTCASGDIKLVVQLKREIGVLWEDIDHAPYKELFNLSITGRYIWNCVRIQRMIDDILDELSNKRTGKDFGIGVHGNRFVSFLVFEDIKTRLNLKDPRLKLEENLSPDTIKKIANDNYDYLIKAVNDKYNDSSLASLFKNYSKCAQLAEYIKFLKSQRTLSAF